ncbi:MAG: hypothetical protein ACI8ZB_003254, partial [Desulforhopalus sp.]
NLLAGSRGYKGSYDLQNHAANSHHVVLIYIRNALEVLCVFESYLFTEAI